ncbi:MAG TPA: 3'-5' exonuclease [Spongiibacteraceae bacterium]|nr:3'-5' exonuclease [Spongiibacteraceae bacterium]
MRNVLQPDPPQSLAQGKSNVTNRRADSVVVLDFETTGLCIDKGDRAIEVGAVLVEEGRITRRFQQLMNPGVRINEFVESLTGISNRMLAKAPPCAEVMEQFADFIGDHNLVAHNASFDKRVLDAELQGIKRHYGGKFACSLLVSRRIYPDAPNHKLGGLVAYKQLATDGVFHRALADSEMTARLWLKMLEDIVQRYPIPSLSFRQLRKLSRQKNKTVHKFLTAQCALAGPGNSGLGESCPVP